MSEKMRYDGPRIRAAAYNNDAENAGKPLMESFDRIMRKNRFEFESF